MSDQALRPGLDALLAEREWVRGLARSLVRDAATADDVEQEAWLAALRSPPRDAGAVRGWLATVVRNAVRQAGRADARRGAREERAARPDATGLATADVVARAEQQRLLAQAVLDLEEPYRSTVLLRFYDGLPPRAVALRMNAPVETVRARTRRALDRLRERLDHEHGGDGRAWVAALVPLLGLRPASGASGGGLITGATIMGAKATVTAAVVALGLGAFGGWLIARPAEDGRGASNGESPADLAAAEGERERLLGEVDRTRGETNVLSARAREAERRAAELEARVAELTTDLAEARAALAAADGPVEQPVASHRIAFPEYGEALAEVDWAAVGENLAKMAPLLRDFDKELRETGKLPGAQLGKIQQHNGPLVVAALRVAEVLPGTGANGSFTHPAFQGNAIAAALSAAGKPLSEEQATRLEALTRTFAAEDRRRLEGYPEGAHRLAILIDEADLRRRYFESAFEILTEEQGEAIRPSAVRGRGGLDLYSDGLIWMQVVRPVRGKDRAEMAASLPAALLPALHLDPDGEARARTVMADWFAHLPEDLVAWQPDALDQMGMLRTDRIRTAAGHTLELQERLVREVALQGDALAEVRGAAAVLVPWP